jgi:hypothetical protein
MTDDNVPKFELDPDAYNEQRGEPREERSEEEKAATYLRLIFENYDEEIIRDVFGERYEEKKRQYEHLVKEPYVKLDGTIVGEHKISKSEREEGSEDQPEQDQRAGREKTDKTVDERSKPNKEDSGDQDNGSQSQEQETYTLNDWGDDTE